MEYKLSRKVNHDERSRKFAFDTTNIQIVDVIHERYIPILNQGQVGSCTGNAGIGAISTAPFPNLDNTIYTRDEQGALKLYSDAEMIDGDGPYPPHDNGSSGLSIAKALKAKGLISGYQHNFTLQDTLKSLVQYPLLVGINWYEGMFTPDADGRVHLTGKLAGGHEVEAYRIDTENGRVWFHNSWDKTWGINGDFYLTWADLATLLSQQGDSTILFPPIITPPAPKKTVSSVAIKRNSDNGTETLGTLTITYSDGSIWSCSTLERPWKDNMQNMSCIPKGSYPCSIQPFHSSSMYQLKNVPGRTGIFIHVANYVSDLLGCIALGINPSDINHDGQIDVTNSKPTIAQFMTIMNNKPFTLTIE